MSTLDLGAAEQPVHSPHSLRASASPITASAAQELDTGDFYIGSTKINAIPQHSAVQVTRLNPAN